VNYVPIEDQAVPVLGDTERPLKIVMFPLTWVLAHVGRTVLIAKELRSRGHQVVFAGDNPDHPMSRLGHAVKEGFRAVHVKEPDWPWAWDRFQNRGGVVSFLDALRSQSWAPLDQITEDTIRVASEENADLIVGDASIGVTTAGYILGIPAAGLLNAYNSHFFRPWCVYRGLIRAVNSMAWAPIRARVYEKYGVRPVNAIELLRNAPLLSPDLPEFHRPHGSYPNWLPIGPLVSEPPFPLPDWYDELADGTTNVYITMGSTGLLEPILRRGYDTLGRAPYRFIVTTGGQVSEEGMAMAPDNFRFARYAPGSKLLQHCAAMVFHGGNGTMYQALGAGVPMLALPSHLEQLVGSRVLEKEGFGMLGVSRRITGQQLLKKIETLVHDIRYRSNAWRFRNAVLHSTAPAKAADILIAHARKQVRARSAAV
jgi:UDP:flavonoid glycosyltransferase YjiC (YdhE family)